MDKKKKRTDKLAAGREKLQQFRQKKAGKGADQKGSTSQGNSSKKSSKAEKNEPKPDTSAASDEAATASHVSGGGTTSHVNFDEEVVDSPQISANALAHEEVSVTGSSSELDIPQPGNTTTSIGLRLLLDSENKTNISLSTRGSIDKGAVSTIDSLTSDPTYFEKGATHDDALINVDDIAPSSGNIVEGEGVKVESGSGNVEKAHQSSSPHECPPDVSLILARGDQVTDVGEMQEYDGLHMEKFSESSEKADMEKTAIEEGQTNYPAVVDSSTSAPHVSEGSLVPLDSVELEAVNGKTGSHQIKEATLEEKPETSIDSRNSEGDELSAEPEESSVVDVASQQQFPESVSIPGFLTHEEPRKMDTFNPSGEVSEGHSVSFLQLVDIVKRLGQDEYQVLCNARGNVLNTDPATRFLEQLREELFVSNTMKDILQVQLAEHSNLQSESDHQCNQLVSEMLQLRASYDAVLEQNASLAEELLECQSKLYTVTSSNERLENQLLATEAQVEDFTAKVNELQLSLEKSQLDLSEAKDKFIKFQVESDTLVSIIYSVNDEKKELLDEKESKNYEIEHLSSELCNCKNLVGILKAEVDKLEKAIAPLTDEKTILAEEKYNLLSELENLQAELANSKTLVTLQESENSNTREMLSLTTDQQTKLGEENLHLTEQIEKAYLELNEHLILETALWCEYYNLKEEYSLLDNKVMMSQEEKEHLVEDNDKLTRELLLLQERLSTVQEERTHLTVELEEATARFDRLAEENLSLSSIVKAEKANVVDVESNDASGLINHEMSKKLGRSSEEQVISKQSAGITEHTCQSLNAQYTKLEVTDDSSEFSALYQIVEKGGNVVQNLEEAIKQILTDSELNKSSSKAVAPGVSKLIQAFESKLQHEDQESEEAQLISDQSEADHFVSVNGQIRNLRDLFENLVSCARMADIKFKQLHDDRTVANERLREFDVDFASYQDHINHLEADCIENMISVEALKNYSYELQYKNQELELLCTALELRNNNFGIENMELSEKQISCLSRVNDLESQLESLQQNSSSMLSSVEEQLAALQDESERAMMLEHELTSSISEIGEAVVRLDDCIVRSGASQAHTGLDLTKRIVGSVDVAVKMIVSLEEKLEAAYGKHESSSSTYEELKQSYNALHEKNESITATMGKVYTDLRNLIAESRGSMEMADLEIENLAMSDPFTYDSFESLMEAVQKIFSERRELQTAIDKLHLDLLSKTKDMEELTQQSLDSTSLRELVQKVEGVLEPETAGVNFESFSSYVEFLVSHLVQKFIETEELASLSRKQLESKENELMEIQEILLHHKTEMDGLKENLSQAETSLVAVRSELQAKSNELEQSEQRLLSTREKLSIAVAKGKGLVVQRDNLKQSLSQTSTELQRSSEELNLKATRLEEVETKLKSYAEAGERVEALESELSYIRNSANALRESFLLKDSLLHRIEEILVDLDLPEHFHARDILEKVEWLARSANGNSLRPSDWDQKSSDGATGFVIPEPWREDVQTGTSSEDDLRIKFEELQGKFYGLAEQNEMLEQSLVQRNNLVQRWEEILASIDMPSQLQSMEVENKIEWLAGTISEATHDKDTLQQKFDNLELYCQSLNADLEVSQKQVSDVEENLQSVVNERVNLSERLETLIADQESLSARAIHLEVENEKLQNQVKDLHEKLTEKLGNEEHLQAIEGELSSLRHIINDIIEEDGLQDLALAGNSETLEGLLRKLIEYYKDMGKSSLPSERDSDFNETRQSDADVRSRESLVTDEATSLEQQPELTNPNLVEATSRDITVVETSDVTSLKKDLEEALHVQKLAEEERDLYIEKQQSLVVQNESLDKKIIELQELLGQEEQKTASVREKLNVAVRKGKALVQQRDSLKQTIEEMSAEVGRLKTEIMNREETLLENDKKFRELESYTSRVEVLESECQSLKNRLQETENILQERSGILSMTLNALNSIDICDEGDLNDPVLKLQQISQRFHNMSTTMSAAEQESKKSRRAAELLLAELNEVQERNDGLQEEISKFEYEIQQLSRQKDEAEAAQVEAMAHIEKLSVVYPQLRSFVTNVNTLRKKFAGTSSCLADIFTRDMEFLHHLKTNVESCAKQTGTQLPGWPQHSTGNFVNKENLSRLNAWSNVNVHEISTGGDITELAGSVAQSLDGFVADVSLLEENLSKHLVSWHEQVNTASNIMDTFFKSIGKGNDSEIADFGERIALLHGACSSVLSEIESHKAELVRNNDINSRHHQVGAFDGREDYSSMEGIKSMANRLSSAVKELTVANAETWERKEKEMKIIMTDLQRELHEKDIQNDRICNELVGQVKEAQTNAKRYAEDLQSASARMHEMQDQLGILTQERDSMKDRLKELQEGQASYSELQEEVRSLKDLLAAKDQEIEALMQALDEEESQMEDLKHRVTELEQELQQKNQDLQNTEASRGKISKKLSITVNKFDELHHLSENLLAEIEKLQQQVQDRDTEVSFLRQEVTRCTNEALVASQMDTKRDSEEIKAVLSWFDATATLLGLEDSPSTDPQSHINHYMEALEKRITSILSEIDEARLVGQSKDSLLEAERSRVAELRQKEATLQRILREKESEQDMSMSSTSEIVEVEPLINKRTTSGTIPSQVRSLRKGNTDQVAISIDADQADQNTSLEEDDDKAHGFKSLSTSRIIPRFTRPVTNMIDGLWVSCDRTLMRQPALRLGIMIYWAILHALLAAFVV